MRYLALAVFVVSAGISLTLYAIVFKQAGPAKGTFEYITSVLFNPLFIIAIALAFGGALLRMYVFQSFGITKSAIMTESYIVLALVGAFIVSRESPDLKFFLGTAAVLVGIFILQL